MPVSTLREDFGVDLYFIFFTVIFPGIVLVSRGAAPKALTFQHTTSERQGFAFLEPPLCPRELGYYVLGIGDTT
jgi:hypothetical protein